MTKIKSNIFGTINELITFFGVWVKFEEIKMLKHAFLSLTDLSIWRTGPSVFLVVKLNFYLFEAVKQFFRKQKWIQKN
jgi:hypothetical protein